MIKRSLFVGLLIDKRSKKITAAPGKLRLFFNQNQFWADRLPVAFSIYIIWPSGVKSNNIFTPLERTFLSVQSALRFRPHWNSVQTSEGPEREWSQGTVRWMRSIRAEPGGIQHHSFFTVQVEKEWQCRCLMGGGVLSVTRYGQIPINTSAIYRYKRWKFSQQHWIIRLSL